MGKPLNILFISYDGMTDPLGQSQVIPYMQGIKKAGYHVTILSCEKPDIYHNRKQAIAQILDAAGIDWVPLMYTKNPPVISTVFDTWNLKRAAARIHQQKNIQLVHTRSGTPALVGRWLKQKFGIKFLHDIRDFYADSRVDSGSWNQSSLLYRNVYRYLKKQEALQLKDCDAAVCLTHAAEKIIRATPEFGKEKPLMVIPCSVDIDLFSRENIDQAERKALSASVGIKEGDVIITYLGSIGGWYLVAEMMQFFAKLLSKMPTARFLFISPHLHDFIVETARKHGVPEEKIISVKGNRQEIPMLLSLSDYSIFFIKPCFSKQASSPTKHGELMAMGIPVITNTGVGDLEAIVNKYKGGILLNGFTAVDYAEAVEKLDQTVFDPKEIRAGALAYYSLSNAVEKYKTVYNTLLSS